jgi:tRNA pseudouridine55 synthase
LIIVSNRYYLYPVLKINLKETDWVAGQMLLVNKPLNWTSFQAVNKIKYLLKKPKIGHSGTLDPLATGLLIMCTGKWTKKLTELTGLPKQYTGSITIGAVTPTYDLESEPEQHKDIAHITELMINEATKNFMGTIQQLPPIHSAIKQKGKPIYLAARKGIEVKVEPRTVTITNFEITKVDGNKIFFCVDCTSGTYIRSLANDFGHYLGVGGYLSSLCRTKIGEYDVANAWDLEEIIQQLDKKP